MTIVLSHESALRYWLTASNDGRLLDPSWSHSLTNASGNMRDIKCAELPFEYSSRDKLHVLVADHDSTRNQLKVVTHRWAGPVPSESLCEYSDTCLISSPEFTFLQLAGSKSIMELIEVGTYLCAGFSITELGDFNELRAPVTKPERVESYLACVRGSRGATKAQNALCHVVPNTASPMEILLCLAFTLPRRLGGWGYPEARANEELDVPDHLRATLRSRTLRCDLYFPSVRGDIEYDSAAFHSDTERLDYTQTRRNLLEAMGVKTVSATKGQLNTYERFRDFMWMAIERLGLPWRPPSKKTLMKQCELYGHLTSKHSLF